MPFTLHYIKGRGPAGRATACPAGRVLGGCSSINGMIYMRGQARDYDHWRQLGNSGWSWDDVPPYFIKSEDQAADMIREDAGSGRADMIVRPGGGPHQRPWFRTRRVCGRGRPDLDV